MRSKEKIEVWLSRVCEQVRWRPARAAVKKELADHIEDQTEAYLAAGIPREEAQLRALEQMGDADMVGEQLNAAWQPGRLPLQALCAVGLFVFWAVVQQLADINRYDPIVYLIVFACGLFCCLLFMRMQPEWMATRGLWLSLLAGIGISLPLRAQSINGVRWLIIGGFSINYIYIFLSLLPFYGILIWRLRGRGLRSILETELLFLPALGLMLAVPIVPTALWVTVCGLLLLTAAVLSGQMGCSKKAGLALVWLPAGGVLAVCAAGVCTNPYRLARIRLFFDPAQDPAGRGWAQMMARQIMEQSSFWGGVPTTLLEQLPSAESDYLLTWCVGRWGKWTLLLAVLLIAGLVFCAVRCARRQKSLLGKLVCIGVAQAFLFQSLCCLSGSVGIGWLSGLPLPFFSNSSAMINSMLLGFLLAASRYGSLWKDRTVPCRKLVEKTENGEILIRL